MQRFDVSELEQVIEQDARDAMLDVILSWVRFDTFVSKWMSLAFGTSTDATVILIGAMDTRNKLDKLKALYEHFGLDGGAESVVRLRQAHGEFVDLRNDIAHLSCVGRQKSDPTMVVFSSVRRVKKEVGLSQVVAHPIARMEAATQFAMNACLNINAIIEKLEGPVGELAVSDVDRLRAVTEDDVSAALNGSCVADLTHRVEPAELVEFLHCLADRLFGQEES